MTGGGSPLAPPPLAPPAERARLFDQVLRHGDEAVAFQATESAVRGWFPDGSGEGAVAYVDTGAAWVAVGSPLGSEDTRADLARGFIRAAAAAGRRAIFFGVERTGWVDDGLRCLSLGEQPEFTPAEWLRTLTGHRSLREQLRRARAKGVRVREVRPEELVEGSALRGEVEDLAEAWLRGRNLEPMGFLVALEPFWNPSEHRYLVAEREGVTVGFLSAVPIPREGGFLVEDLLRGRSAPNGTTELLLDALMRSVAPDVRVTLGLAPLSGAGMARWTVLARALGRPLYDFRGLRAFKARLRPSGWRRVWLVRPRRQGAILAIWDALSAFAAGRPFRFLGRSLLRHPAGFPWLLSLPLVPWTLVLAGVLAAGRARWMGFGPWELLGWIVFDAVLAVALFCTALAPRRRWLSALAAAAGIDALLSVNHLVTHGFGISPIAWVLRSLATAAPILGTAVLAWSALHAARGSRASGRCSLNQMGKA